MSMQLFQVVASRLNMQPALVAQAHTGMVAECLRQLAHADEDREEAQQIKARKDMLAAYGYAPTASDKPFIYADGIAFIPITGMLVNRFNSSYGWVTGYNFIRSWLNAAIDDGDVKLIVFDCNSGGGEVAGCFELAADIRAAREKKPSIAVVDSSCYSGCYALASAASRIVCTPSGGVGSIGVLSMHINMAKMLSDYGVEITLIVSGDHKADGNPYEPLPEPVRKSIKARVDTTRQKFVSLVADYRGLDAQVVYDTQAQCYTASEALDLGLIDAIAPPLEAVQAFLTELSGSFEQEISTMSTATKPGAEGNAATPEKKEEAAVTTVPTAGAAPAAAAAGTVDANAERLAERERVKGITTHENAKGKSALANHLALNTTLSIEEAAGILAASPLEKVEPAAAGSSAFLEAMNAGKHPEVGSGEAGEMTAAQKILKSQELATGVKR